MARAVDQRWLTLIKKYQSTDGIARAIVIIKGNQYLYDAFKNWTGKTIDEVIQ